MSSFSVSMNAGHLTGDQADDGITVSGHLSILMASTKMLHVCLHTYLQEICGLIKRSRQKQKQGKSRKPALNRRILS